MLTDWTPPPLPARAALAGRYARLEPLDLSHAEGLFAAFSEDPSMWDYMPVGPFAEVGAVRDWIAGQRILHDPLHWAVRMADGRLGGTLSLLRITPAAGSIEVGFIAFAPRLQRTREASEAVILLTRWAFEAGYRRFEWKCDSRNLPSRRAAQRYGFSYEGIFRQAAVVKGRNRDTAWFAAIDGEWPALSVAYEAWLAPGNFDDTGQQRQSLSALTAPILVARDPALG